MHDNSASTSLSGHTGPLRAFVVDDDDIARELICSTLRRAGYDTFELSSPTGATQCVFEQQIDIAVLDVLLPAVNGNRIAELLSATPAGERLVIALVSSRPLTELEALAQEAGADTIVSKRDIRQELVRRVGQSVKERRGAASRVTTAGEFAPAARK